MKKYVSIFRMRFIGGMQYRAAALAGIVTQFFWGFLEILMFYAFYESNPGNYPMGFSGLASYIWMQQAFLALYMVWFWEADIFEAIRSGNIAYELCRPVGLYSLWFTRGLANRLSRAVLRCFPILIVAVLLPEPFCLGGAASIQAGLWFALSMVLAFLVVVAFGMIVYFVSFFTLHPVGVRFVSSSLAELLSGAVVPLPFLPAGLRRVVELLPFASMQNAPLRIWGGSIAGAEIYRTVGLQLFWLLALVAVGQLLCHSVLSKTIIQGG